MGILNSKVLAINLIPILDGKSGISQKKTRYVVLLPVGVSFCCDQIFLPLGYNWLLWLPFVAKNLSHMY